MVAIDFLKPENITGKRRLGDPRDGGYVIYERILPETDVLVSYGIGWNISFEEEFNALTNKMVLMFDPTLVGKYIFSSSRFIQSCRHGGLFKGFSYARDMYILWTKKRKLARRNIHFVNEGLLAYKKDKYDSFESHIQRFGLEGKSVLLKIDIEWMEYGVFEDPAFVASLRVVNQLVIEFHNLSEWLHRMRVIVERLQDSFDLIHIHGNNYTDTFSLAVANRPNVIDMPNAIELAFVRKDRIKPEDRVKGREQYPVAGLDFPNDPNKEDYSLEFIC